MRVGTILHFHEIARRGGNNGVAKMGYVGPNDAQDELKALYDFLLRHPGIVLRLLPIQANFQEPAMFVVERIPHFAQTNTGT